MPIPAAVRGALVYSSLVVVVAGCNGDSSSQPDASSDASVACDSCASDPQNCGTVGHDCLGGQCVSGVCQPVTLVSSAYSPFTLAINDTTIFWDQGPGPSAIAKGGLMSCAKAGCNNSPTTLASGVQGGALAANATDLYWIESPAGLRTCAIAGCSPTTFFTGGVSAFTLGATNISWTDGQDAAWFCPLAGCGAGPTLIAAAQPQAQAIAADQANAYWMDFDFDGGVGMVIKASISANAATTMLVDHQSELGSVIAVDATNVYWTRATAGTVLSCNKEAGCDNTPTMLASGQRPMIIVVDDSDVYWVNGPTQIASPTATPSSSIMKCAKTGCGGSPTVVLSNVSPVALAIDATALYWADVPPAGLMGSIMKIAK